MVVWGVSCADVPRTRRPAVVDCVPEALGTSRVLGVWHERPGGVSGYVEVMAPIQLGDELRAALVSAKVLGCAVAASHRHAERVHRSTRSHWYVALPRTSPKVCVEHSSSLRIIDRRQGGRRHAQWGIVWTVW